MENGSVVDGANGSVVAMSKRLIIWRKMNFSHP